MLTVEDLVEVLSQVTHMVEVGPTNLLPEVRINLVDRPVDDGLQLVTSVLHSDHVQLAELLISRMINKGAELLGQVPLMHGDLVNPVLRLLEEKLAREAHEDI